MSSLSVLNPEFIQYLYKNNIKLETYESPLNDNIISGFWTFLDKYENKNFIRMNYYINKNYKYLSVSFTSYKNSITKHVKQVAYITILYFFSIYSMSEGNNINFDNFEYPEYKCFLCDNNECLLCKLCKNDIYTIITDKGLFSKLQNTLISSQFFDTQFIRNFLYKNKYRIFVQEFLQPIVPEDKIIYQNFHDPRNNIDGIFGRITLRRENEIINIDYTYTKKTLNMTIKESTFEKDTLTLLEMIILHFISGYSTSEIMVRFSSDKNYIYELLHKIGFNNTNDVEKELFYVIFNFVDLEDPSIILKINYEKIFPYIQEKWNMVKGI